jgi:hypothetical protein
MDDEILIGKMVESISQRLGPGLPHAVIEENVRDCFRQWADASVRDFIPVLAERCVWERLRGR